MKIFRKKYGSMMMLAVMVALLLLASSCKKLVEIDEPISTITEKEVFSTDALATAAMTGVYTQMINGTLAFSNGAVNFYGGYSADEFLDPDAGNATTGAYTGNRLTALIAQPVIWSSAYNTIYGANAVIEGLAASQSPALHDSVKAMVDGEARLVRAFSYFYLVNFYGEVPLALTIDFNKTIRMPRTPQEQVYAQIVDDLKKAQEELPAYFPGAGGERIYPTRWAATALLARVFLYQQQWQDALEQATAVINQPALFNLAASLDDVFNKNSGEAIWQLQQNNSAAFNGVVIGNATIEGFSILPNPLNTGALQTVCIAPSLLNAFETGDKRKTTWMNSTTANGSTQYYPFKYRTGAYNMAPGAEPTEYYMVLRLAEMYLVRAEAAAHGAGGGFAAAIGDLNMLRRRAALPDLPDDLSGTALLNAISHERQTELFAEWGHRWLDLKRTGKAKEVLSQITYKQPWQGDYQLLYPVPPSEIQADPALIQSPGY